GDRDRRAVLLPVDREGAAAPPLLDRAEADVPEDAVEPGEERLARPEPRDRLPGPEEGLLRRVEGLFPVVDDHARDPEGAGEVGTDELLERRSIPAPRAGEGAVLGLRIQRLMWRRGRTGPRDGYLSGRPSPEKEMAVAYPRALPLAVLPTPIEPL